MNSPEFLSISDSERLERGICPDCGATMLIAGPRGGDAQNLLCAYCRAEFNLLPMLKSRRLIKPCYAARQKEFYGIDVRKFPVNTFPKFGAPRDRQYFEESIAKGCQTPGCEHDHPELLEIFFHPRCHPHAGLSAVYRKGTGELFIGCRECGRPTVVVALAERERLPV